MDFNAEFEVKFTHRLRFTRDVFSTDNDSLINAIRDGQHIPARVQVFVDQGFLDQWPQLTNRIRDYFDHHSDEITLVDPIERVQGGEACKNDQQLQYRLCHAMNDAQLCRQSYALVIGGGAVLDAVGFAASMAHRGVRLIRMPTTTLSQDDSGIGVKNGINGFNKKNYLGTFAVPWAVINDELFLTTLSDRDWRAGFIEAVKVALIKDAALFEQIRAEADQIVTRDLEAAMPVIIRSAELHLRHITEGGDAFELTTARPLDFGHWAAHKLEQMSYFDLRHGEAVAIGIALDVIYSNMVGLLHDDDTEEILDCLRALGYNLWHDTLRDGDQLMKGLDEFQEHLGGELTIALLEGIGKSIDVHEIDTAKMRQAIEQLAIEATVR